MRIGENSPTLKLLSAAQCPLARFSISGFDCVIVPSHEDQSAGGHILGTLIVDGISYAIRGTKLAMRTPDLIEVLTPRELEIALLIAAGEKSKAIARRLRISFHTVRVHVGHIYAKLGLRKQTELAAHIAARFGRSAGASRA